MLVLSREAWGGWLASAEGANQLSLLYGSASTQTACYISAFEGFRRNFCRADTGTCTTGIIGSLRLTNADDFLVRTVFAS